MSSMTCCNQVMKYGPVSLTMGFIFGREWIVLAPQHPWYAAVAARHLPTSLLTGV